MMGEEISRHLKNLHVILIGTLTWSIVSLINMSAPAFADPTSTWIVSPFAVAYAMLIPLVFWRYKAALPVTMVVFIIGIITIIVGIAQEASMADYLSMIWLVFCLVLKVIGVFFAYTSYKELK